MRKFWKRRVKAKDVQVIVTRQDTGIVVMDTTAETLQVTEDVTKAPAMFFAGGAAYDVSFRRRTK